MTKTQNTDTTKCWWSCGTTGTFIHCWWECKRAQPLWNPVLRFPTKLNIHLPYDPATALLGIYQMSWNLFPHKDLHMDVYSNFIHNCQNLEDNVLLFSAKKKWAIKPQKTWRKLKCILLSERSEYEKATDCRIPTIWHSGKGKTMETVKNQWLPGVGGREGWIGGAQRSFRQWNYSVWYQDSGYMSLYSCQNS